MRSPLGTKLLALAAFGLVSAAVVAGTRVCSSTRRAPTATTTSSAVPLDAESNIEGRALLNRAWFDRLPTSAKDDVDLWIFFSGGIGLTLSGSGYRWKTEIFDLERAKNRLELVALQDKATLRLGFEIKACDDKPPFDACLHLSEPLRGKKVLYGFVDEEEAAHHHAWLRDVHTRVQGYAIQPPSPTNLR